MKLIWSLSAAVLLVSGALLIQSPIEQFDAIGRPQRERENLKVFDKAWSLVDRHYYDHEANRQAWRRARVEYRPKAARAETVLELYWNALQPMMQTLGASHATATPPDLAPTPATTSVRTTATAPIAKPPGGETPWLGMGFTFTFTPKGLRVVSVEPGSPLHVAGVGPGAQILEMHIDPAGAGVSRLQGRFKIAELAPRLVHFNFKAQWGGRANEVRTLGRGALYIRFDRFDHDSVSWVVDKLRSAGEGPVVLDLRLNAGGSTDELTRLAGVLFDRNLAIGYRVSGRKQPLSAEPEGVAYRGPVALLVGPGTASAAEVLTDAVLHYKRGLVVGEKTQGSVLEAATYPLPDGGRLEIPIKDFLGASGRRLEASGVEPSVLVAVDGRPHVRDPVLEKAEELLGAR